MDMDMDMDMGTACSHSAHTVLRTVLIGNQNLGTPPPAKPLSKFVYTITCAPFHVFLFDTITITCAPPPKKNCLFASPGVSPVKSKIEIEQLGLFFCGFATQRCLFTIKMDSDFFSESS